MYIYGYFRALPSTNRGGGAYSKLGAQITKESLKTGCAKPENYLTEAQKVGAQVCPLCILGFVDPGHIFIKITHLRGKEILVYLLKLQL